VSERAALYTVSVRTRARGGPAAPLGDLAGVLEGILDGFSETSPDGSRTVRVAGTTREGDDLFAVVQHGARGVAADIVDEAGAVRLRQRPDDLQLVRSGCLFRLPAASAQGILAVHVSNGRGIKGLFEQGLTSRFRTARPGEELAIERRSEPDALRRAVADDRVEKLRLVRLEQAGERTIPGVDKWVGAGDAARISVDVSPHSRGARIDRALLERYLAGDTGTFAEIVELAGVRFDTASVSVVLPDDTRRLFDLAHPEAGRPASRVLEGIVPDAAGEPTVESLLAALRAALA